MRTAVLIALIVPLAACSVPIQKAHPYAEANSLMQQEIDSRIAKFPFQHRQELLDNMLWLATKAGETAIPALLDVLDHDEPKVRSSALWVLGRIRDHRVIPAVRPLAADENEVVRLEAARTLVTMGDLKYLTILIEGLDSSKTPVRYHCHMALRDSTRKDFSYDHLDDDPESRRRSVLKWREWWATQSSDPWFAASYAKEHGLETSIATPAPAGESNSTGKGEGTDTDTNTGAGTGEPTERHPAEGLASPPEIDQPETTQPRTTQPRMTPPRATQPTPAQPTPAQPRTTQPKPVQPRTTQPRTTQPRMTQPKPAQPKSTQPKSTQPTPVQPTPVQPTPTQPTPTPKPTKTAPKEEPSIFKLLDLSTPTTNDGTTGTGQPRTSQPPTTGTPSTGNPTSGTQTTGTQTTGTQTTGTQTTGTQATGTQATGTPTTGSPDPTTKSQPAPAVPKAPTKKKSDSDKPFKSLDLGPPKK